MCWCAAVTTQEVTCTEATASCQSQSRSEQPFCDAQAVGDNGYWQTQA
jgi:hypothetical protein